MEKQSGGFQISTDSRGTHLEVWGGTLEELFSHALSAVASIATSDVLQLARKTKKIREEITVQAVDINSMLIEFLSEVISRMSMGNAAFTRVSFQEFGENFLSGTLEGALINAPEHEVQEIVDDSINIKKNTETGFFETPITMIIA